MITLIRIIAAIGAGVAVFFIAGDFSAVAMVGNDSGFAAAATVALVALIAAIVAMLIVYRVTRRLSESQLPIVAGLLLIAAAVSWFVVSRRANSRVEQHLAAASLPAEQVDSAGRPIPPPLPPAGTTDTLIGMVSVDADSVDRFEVRETDYEVKAVTVYRQQESWYLVGLAGGGREWIHLGMAGRYYDIGNLVANRLNYMTPAWDRTLRLSPDSDSAADTIQIAPEFAGEVPANVVEVQGRGEHGAWRVEILDRNPCTSSELPKVIGTGWVPMWNEKGEPTAWFYSRGC